MINLITENNADISICNYKRVYNEDCKLNSLNDTNIYSNIDTINAIYKEEYGKMIVAWNKLYKSDIFKGERYPIGRLHEDEFLTPKLLYKANKIVTTNKELVYYRYRKNSITNSEFNLKRLDSLDALYERINFFKLKKLNNLYIKTIETYIALLIECYYKISRSSWNNKKIEMNSLKEEIRNVLNNHKKHISIKCKIKIMIFKFFPFVPQQLIISKIKKLFI